MLVYAPRSTATRSPRTLILVAAGHVVALALVLTARSEFARQEREKPIDVIHVPLKAPPPPPPSPDPVAERPSAPSTVTRVSVIVPIPGPTPEPFTAGPTVITPDPVIGPAIVPLPSVPEPTPAIVRKAPRFVTPADRVRPPYPEAKRRLEEEARLRLSLVIDPRGRVTSVSPVGPADAAFLDAARRHIVRHWRYQPASEGGSAVAATIVVTLTFTLEE